MRQAGDPQSLLEQSIEVVDFAFQRVGALDQVQPADHGLTVPAAGHQFLEVLPAFDKQQFTVAGESLQLVELVCRSLVNTEPGARRPERDYCQQGNVVRIRRIAVVVETGRTLRCCAENLQRNIAGMQTRQIHVPDRGPFCQVALP